LPKSTLEKILSAPAVSLDKGLHSSGQWAKNFKNNKQLKKAGRFWHSLGPGFTTGAADDDPSGIATYSQAGARYGFDLIWMALLTFPLMAMVQEMCARIGLVTGRGLAGNIRRHYKKWVLYLTTLLLFAANTFNIGANLSAMASSARLILPEMNYKLLIIIFVAVSLFFQIFLSYAQYAKYLKWLTLILLSYILSALSLHLNWREVANQILAIQLNFSGDQIFLICAILGTTISPYLFFWQTSQEVEEKILAGQNTIKLRQNEVKPTELKKMRTDVWSGMFFSNLIMFFIILTCGAALHNFGITNISTASDAAEALRPIAGDYTFYLFALGIIGTGLLAVPVLAGSASYTIAETFGFKQGLFYKLKQASAFYGVIIIAMLFGMSLSFFGLNPIKALIYSAVINGLVAPVILILIVQMAGNSKMMNKHVIGTRVKFIGWLTIFLMVIAGGATIISLII